MKTLRFKVFGFAATAMLMSATFISCGDEDDERNPPTPPTENPADSDETVGSGTVPNDSTVWDDPVKPDTIPDDTVNWNYPTPEVSQIYIGGEYGKTQYFDKYLPTPGTETVITELGNGRFVLTHNSPVWGLFTFNDLEVNENSNGSIAIYGEGTVDMPNNHTGEVTTYGAYVSGLITDRKLVATFSAPGVMGGFELKFNPADFDEVYNNYNSGEVADSTRQAR